MNDALKFVIENRDTIITFFIALIAMLRLTAWGRAQASALDAVIGVIETLGARSVKEGVSDASINLPEGIQDAIDDSVAKADPKKKKPSLLIRIVREVFRVN